MIAVIVAGGKGTRLIELTKNELAKAMVPILNKPILLRQVELLKENGVKNFIFIVGHLKESIMEFFKDGSDFGVKIEYIVEDAPLGTAGALYYLKNKVDDDFIFLNGDLVLGLDFSRLMQEHKKNNSLITLVTHPNSHPFDSDIVVANEDNIITSFDSKHNNRDYFYKNLVTSGVAVISPSALETIKTVEKRNFENEFVKSLIPTGRVFSYKTSEYVKDVGTYDRIKQAESDLKNNVVEERKLCNKQKCIFLDRDGTINKSNGFINTTEKFELLPYVSDAIKLINQSGYLAIVVTNQPVVARGECSVETLYDIHKKMETQLGCAGSYLDDIVFCPHHPDKGFEGEVASLKFDCDCRKPKTKMIEKMCEKHNVDISKSFMVGDSSTDIQTGVNAGLKTIFVKTGKDDNKFNVTADAVVDNLMEAVKFIIKN